MIGSGAWAIVRWWEDWRAFGMTPWGGRDLHNQPAFVSQAFRICETELVTIGAGV